MACTQKKPGMQLMYRGPEGHLQIRVKQSIEAELMNLVKPVDLFVSIKLLSLLCTYFIAFYKKHLKSGF